jgi:glutamine amidotransferase
MCIAIYKPEGSIVPYKTLQRCYDANPDGAGFMYVENKKLHMQKGFFEFKDFWKAYHEHQGKQAVIHFRIKTHGPINTDNCHPFLVNKGLGFVHNGIISGFGKDELSDTRHFNEEIIKPLATKWGNLSIFQPAIKSLIESRIGYSKLIFLDRFGNYDIFNEDKGSWDDKIWYSNTSYKPVAVAKPTSMLPGFSSYSGYVPPAKKNLSLEVGGLVELVKQYKDDATQVVYFKGELLEVVAVNNDYTVDLMFEHASDKKDFLYNIPYSYLKVIEESPGYDDDDIYDMGSDWWDRAAHRQYWS